MSKYLVLDMKGTKELYDYIEDFSEKYDDFLIEFLKACGQRALKYTIENTPVGVYGPKYGMVGGTLKRAWKLTPVKQNGLDYVIVLYADPYIAPYALYVEEGHRTVAGYVFQLPDGTWRRTKAGWVEGKHMSRDATEKVNRGMTGAYNRAFEKFIKRLEAAHG